MARWKAQGRDDILAWVVWADSGGGLMGYTLWVDPQTGLPADHCPWLVHLADGTCGCNIHSVRPLHCRSWPPTREDAASFDCPCAEDP